MYTIRFVEYTSKLTMISDTGEYSAELLKKVEQIKLKYFNVTSQLCTEFYSNTPKRVEKGLQVFIL